jgi:putative FmdB family regulatory protein
VRCPATPPTTLLPPMPIYEYRCTNGHTFEVTQSMSDDPVETCEVCGAPVERVFHPVAVHFKGSGFYSTDYKSKGKAASGKDGDSSSSDSGSDSSSSESSAKKSDSAGSDKAATSSSSD